MNEGNVKVDTGGFSIYSKPSLPYLLSEYGFEDKETFELRKKKEEKRRQEKLKKKQAKKTGTFGSSDDEKDVEKEKERDQHYEQMIRDLHRLRDYYHKEYTGMLTAKVEKQKKEQRERDAIIQKQREKDEEEARKASHRVKKRLERHTLATTPFTVDVPKTALYHIIGLENKLQKEGKFKTTTDYNNFRESIAQPHIFNQYFNKEKDLVSTDNASSHKDSSEVFSLAPDPPEVDNLLTGTKNSRSLSRISEARESSRPGTQMDNWAITQQYPSIHKSRKSLGQIGKQKSEYKQDLEKRFPKLEMPKLHCFNMNLAKKPPDPEEVRQQQELRAREKQRKRAARTYTKMYQLAMSNAAVSARIFDLHEDMDMMIYGPELCDVIADNHWMEAYGLKEDEEEFHEEEEEVPERHALPPSSTEQFAIESQANSSSTTEKEQKESNLSGEMDASDTNEENSEGQRKHQVSSAKQQSAKSQKSAASEKMKSPLPLTMNEIHEDCNIKEAKTLSTMWNNYLRAGKPRAS